jgi:hypothetical protein
MAKHETLNDAMSAGDLLAEVEIRYRLLAEAFEDSPQLRSQLNTQLERAKSEIAQLRAMSDSSAPVVEGTGRVVAFDAGRFRKSG